MRDPYQEALHRLKASKKYSGLCPETLERTLEEAFLRHKKPRDAEKAARERLHGITGAFLGPENLVRAEELLSRWSPGDDGTLEKVLALHASTSERLPLKHMDAMYSRVFQRTGRPKRILDLACGLNPVYLGARGLATLGVDIHRSAAGIVHRWAVKNSLPVEILPRDLTLSPPPEGEFDLALMMKLLPVLERQRPGAAKSLMEGLGARWVAVSFPTRSLSGRAVGMEEHYRDWFAARIPAKYRLEERFVEGNELIYIFQGREV